MMTNKTATRRVGRIAIQGFLIVQMMFGYFGQATLTAQAQGIIPDAINTSSSTVTNAPQYNGGAEQSIKDYLCAPDESNLGVGLYTCITKLYRFGIAFGAIALVFFVVYAGYMYIAGGEASKTKGKDILLSAITGMAVILSSYVLLSFINPDLVRIKVIQPPIFSASSLPKCEDVGLGVNCILPNGQVQAGNYSGPAGDVKQFVTQIKDNSTKFNLEPCMLEALIQKESGANPYIASTAIVGSDKPGPAINLKERTADGPPSNRKGHFGMNFTATERHAIGLTQITIYSPGFWGGSPIPARPEKELDSQNGQSRNLTIAMLLDPSTNVAAGALHFSMWYRGPAGKVAHQAYAHYFAGKNGPKYYNSTYVQGYKKLYDACKARPQ